MRILKILKNHKSTQHFSVGYSPPKIGCPTSIIPFHNRIRYGKEDEHGIYQHVVMINQY